MSDVHLEYVNAAYVRIKAEPALIMELSEYFTYYADNYRFHPKVRARLWDGKIRMLKRGNLMYAGLAKRIKKFCDMREYTITWDKELFYNNVTKEELDNFIASLNIPNQFENREYQIDSILKCIRSKRRTLISPTSSGKSFMMYILSQWFAGEKCLIIVPTTGLVTQMSNDFISYGYKEDVHLSTNTKGLDSSIINQRITITTWQSIIARADKEWFEQFDLVFGDEAHGAKAMSLINIMESLTNAKYRFGTTGTLDDKLLNDVTIEGLFGPKYQAVTTKELMDQGHVSKLKIKCIVLKYPEEVCKEFHKPVFDNKKKKNRRKNYAEEIEFITNSDARNKYVRNLTLSLEGNKLLFFRIIEHGKKLYDLIREKTDHNIFYIDGGVKPESREAIRHAIEDENNAVLIASLGTTSTGVSINKLHHMIAASPSKSKIKVLQSIGRMLRKHSTKDAAVLYDIVDDLSYKSKRNYILDHFIERTKIYDKEKFDYKIINIEL